MNTKWFVRAVTALSLSIAPLSAEEKLSGAILDEIPVTIVGMGSIEAGQAVKGQNRQSPEWETWPFVNHVWYQRQYMHLGARADIGKAHIDMIGEARISYSWRIQQEFYDDLQPRYQFYPHHMEGSYLFGDAESRHVRLGVGIFPYKYNPDVRNLGEYLYRTGTYPGYIMSEFDFPLARLTGFRASARLLNDLNIDLMLTSESHIVPLNDWGISLLGDYTVANTVTVGGGVFFSHLLSVNEYYTTPKVPNNLIPPDSMGGDSVYYTFRGTKLMGKVAFDPKPLLLSFASDLFGSNDLRLYSEVAVIGLKNYPVFYSDIKQRIPVTVGFNLPTFKILDVLAVEWEYYGSRLPNSFEEVFYRRSLPLPPLDKVKDYDWKRNQRKWSVYASKKVARCFSFCGQVAFDHMRLLRHDQKNQDLEETLRRYGDWAWMFKTQFSF